MKIICVNCGVNIAVIYATFAVAKRKPEKPVLYGIRTLDLCDTGAALY